jgi:hypothetical protein
MVFICLHPAAKIPHITETTQQSTGIYYGVELYAYSDNNTNKPKPKITNTGTYDGVYLYASSSKNTTYNQDYTTSQEHQAMVFLCMQTAITTHHINKTMQHHRNITRCLSVCIQQQKYHI